MKNLTRRQFTAAGILAAMSLTGASLKSCNPFAPDENEIEAVYGPPEDYDPSENELVDVYGPPEDFEQTSEPNDSDEQVSEDYEPSDNELAGVYGPPEVVDVDGYDASENISPCVYGPPPDDDPAEDTTAG